RSLELQVTRCPFFGDSGSLFFDGWRWDFHIRRKWQSEKFQDALRSGTVRRDNVFVKKNQRLNLIFTKIIRPAFVVRCNPIAPFVDYLEIKFGYGVLLRLFLGFLGPHTRLACDGPRNRLLDMVPPAHPDVFRFAENSLQKFRSSEILVFGNLL